MAAAIQPGNLDHRVLLQQEVQTPDGQGGYELAWVTIAPLWANVQSVSGREILHSDKLQGRDLYRITIRNRKGITVAHRLVWNGQVMDIISAIDPGPRAAFRQIEAELGGPT
jgi:SPP1 family predicted phage head-tail adaptor